MNYDVHPFRAAFPDPRDWFVNDLTDEVKRDGLLRPIILFEGKILDGRKRYLACQKADIPMRFEYYQGADPAGYVAKENQLSSRLSLSQLALGVGRVAMIEEEQGQDRRPGLLRKHLGERFGMSEAQAARGHTVARKAVPQIQKLVELGDLSIKKADPIARMDPRSQSRLAAISDELSLALEIKKTIVASKAAKNREKYKAQKTQRRVEPGTAFIRQFLGRLELMRANLSHDFNVSSAAEIAFRFKQDFNPDIAEHRSQFEAIAPLLDALAHIGKTICNREHA